MPKTAFLVFCLELQCNFELNPLLVPTYTANWFGSQSGFGVCKQDSLTEGCTRNFFPSAVQPLMGTGGISGPFQQLGTTFALGTPVQGTRQNVVSSKIPQLQVDVVSSVPIASIFYPVWVALTLCYFKQS